MTEETLKTTTDSVIEIAVKRTESITSSDEHWRKKTSLMKNMAIEQSERMRDKANKLNSLKNEFNRVRQAIAGTGLYHHQLKGSVKKVDKLIFSAYKISDLLAESKSPSDFDKKLKQKANEYIAKSKIESENKKFDLSKEYIEIAESIQKIRVYPESWYHFRLTQSELKAISESTDENKQAKMSDKVLIGMHNYVKVAKKLMNDEYHIRRALGLAMLSGRRMSEIFVAGDFQVSENNNLMFSGAIKKDSRAPFPLGGEWHEIPSIIDAGEFVHFFKMLRKDQRVIDVIEKCNNENSLHPVNRTFSVLAGNNAKSKLVDLNTKRDKKDWKFSDSRAMAVAVAYFIESKKPKGERIEDEVIFYKNYLIHADVEMMLNYREFFIVDDSNDVCNKTLLDKLHDAEEEVLRQAARSKDISQDRFLKVHDSLCDYVSRNPNVKITKKLLKTPRKGGGMGADHALSVAYYEIIKPFIG